MTQFANMRKRMQETYNRGRGPLITEGIHRCKLIGGGPGVSQAGNAMWVLQLRVRDEDDPMDDVDFNVYYNENLADQIDRLFLLIEASGFDTSKIADSADLKKVLRKMEDANLVYDVEAKRQKKDPKRNNYFFDYDAIAGEYGGSVPTQNDDVDSDSDTYAAEDIQDGKKTGLNPDMSESQTSHKNPRKPRGGGRFSS